MITGHWVELTIILIIALIVFGPQRLPEVTSSLGKALREFRRATSELQESVLHGEEPEADVDGADLPPPSPADTSEEIQPTIDTLAGRRESRERRRQETAAAASADIPEAPGSDGAPSAG